MKQKQPCNPLHIPTMLALGTKMPSFTNQSAMQYSTKQPGKRMVEYCKNFLYFDASDYLHHFTDRIQCCNGTKIRKAYYSIIGNYLPFYFAWAHLMRCEQCSEDELKAKMHWVYSQPFDWFAEYNLAIADQRLSTEMMQLLGEQYDAQKWLALYEVSAKWQKLLGEQFDMCGLAMI